MAHEYERKCSFTAPKSVDFYSPKCGPGSLKLTKILQYF